ncbi:MAG: hypothetical protein DMG82_00835 [Acidobacteria bacterium]|nr:MAG: hypothetical protein DMG82_00835 [Acidobacteriota bacterium]
MALGSRVPEIVPENSDEVRPSALRGTGSKSQTKDTRRVRWFKQADQWFTRWISIAGALHEGFWLGVLRADDLDAITAGHYGQSQEYASAEHNQRGLFDWERVVVEQYFQPGSRILVAAAGGGREILALRQVGFQAEGFDCSPTLVQAGDALFDGLGERRGVALCAAGQVPSGPALYQGLIVGWSGYTHIPTRRRRIAFLEGLRNRALPGAPVLISFFPRDRSSQYENLNYWIARVSRFLFRGRKEEPEPGDHLGWCFSHTFTREEVEAELQAAGFRPVYYCELGEGHAVGISE